MKHLDVVLDYDSEAVWMRDEPNAKKMKLRRDRKHTGDVCQSIADPDPKPKGTIDQALDWYIWIDQGIKYLSKPKNIYNELVSHPHAWVLNVELSLGLGLTISTIGILFLSTMTGLIFFIFNLTNALA